MTPREKTSRIGGHEADVERIMAEARSGVATVAPRLATVLRGAPDPNAHAVGKWSVAEVAAHLSHVCAGELMSAASAGAGPGPAIGEARLGGISRFNDDNLDADPERDLQVLASRIEDRVNELLETTDPLRGDETVTWLGGTQLPAALILCHLLEELHLHGYDVARASRQPWVIEPGHAALASGFFFGFLEALDPSARASFVDQDAAAGLRARYEIALRGGRSWFLEFDDGALSMPAVPTGPIDCHLSADPVTFLLIGFGRIGPIRPALTGRIVAWGRKPHLALKFARLLRNP